MKTLSTLCRAFSKIIVMLLGAALSIPFIALGYWGILTGRYGETSAAIGKLPFYAGEYARYFYYKATLKKLGRKVRFKFGSMCQYHTAEIGDNVLIGFHNCLGEVSIGDNVLIGGNVDFLSGLNQHSFADKSKPIVAQAGSREMIHIGRDVWIGNKACVAASIGDRCVVGAGAVVVKPLESGGVYVGNPAKRVRDV